MKALIQRVSDSQVEAHGKITGKIQKGLLILLCAVEGDSERDLNYVVNKVSNLRVFEDADGKMNLSILDVGGEALVVSQFTLAAGIRKGNRPSFDDAEEPSRAKKMYESFIKGLKEKGITVETGIFAAYMKVSLVNDGPVTILIDSREGT